MTLFQKIRSFAENKPGTFWFSFVTLLCSLALFGLEAVKLDVRFMYIVEDISEYGIHATSTINGKPYPDYPSTWMIAAWLTSLCGKFLNRWTLCLPSILSGALSIALICRTGEKVQKGLGHIAALIAVSSFEFMSVFLGFGLDAPVCACGAAMLYFLWDEKSHGVRTHLLFALFLIIGFSVRGPIGAVLIGTGTAAWLLTERRWIGLISYGITGAMVLSSCIGAIYLILQWQGGEALWHLCREWQVSNRMDTRGIDYTFYLLQSYTMYCPASLPLLYTFIFGRRKLFSRPVFGWIAYLLAIEILLTIPGCQHLRYMTLGVPAMALAGAWGLLNIRISLSDKYLAKITFIIGVFLRVVGLVLLLGFVAAAFAFFVFGNRIFVVNSTLKHFCCVVSFIGIVFSSFWIRSVWKTPHSSLAMIAGTLVRLACFVLLLAGPVTAVLFCILGFGICYVMLIGTVLASLLTAVIWKLVPLNIWYSFASFAVGGCLATLFVANPVISTLELTAPSVRAVEELVDNRDIYFYHIDADHEGIKYLISIHRDRVKKIFFVDPECSDLTRNMYQVIYYFPSDISDAYVIIRDKGNEGLLPDSPDWENPPAFDEMMNEIHRLALSRRCEIVRRIRLGHKTYDVVHLTRAE